MKTAILGAGKMGVWFAKFCKEKGDNVILADRKKQKLSGLGKELGVETTDDFTKAVKAADRIMICVSISSFEEVVKKIGSSVRDGQAVMDICSIKEYPVKVMHENIKHGLVLGTHPVFGLGSKGVKHKAYVLTPTNAAEEKYADDFKEWLEKEEAHVFIMTPKKHDQLMSVVLGLPHFLGLVACETLLEQKDFPETKQVAGTTYRLLFTLAEATALETPDLYANLQTNLPEMGKIEDLYIAKAQEWLDLIKQKNPQAIVDRMAQVKEKLLKADPDFAKSYEVMYRMLEATEE
ncbi:MAG: prephenate dehydrogenase/arogenate dehydrogenase family protein [Candidatus Bathyarchaeia archaeon]|jgi:prephenate dehydrogenase